MIIPETFRVFPFFGLVFSHAFFRQSPWSPCLPEEAAQKYRPGTFVPDDKKEIQVSSKKGSWERWQKKSDVFEAFEVARVSQSHVHVLLKEGNGDDETQNPD